MSDTTEENNPPRPSGDIWPEISRLREKIAEREAEVERLKELLNRAINEIEKTPFHTPKLTAFTAHRLAERYREEITNNSTKPQNAQENDK
jgi:regulator of replication initiation timing